MHNFFFLNIDILKVLLNTAHSTAVYLLNISVRKRKKNLGLDFLINHR